MACSPRCEVADGGHSGSVRISIPVQAPGLVGSNAMHYLSLVRSFSPARDDVGSRRPRVDRAPLRQRRRNRSQEPSRRLVRQSVGNRRASYMAAATTIAARDQHDLNSSGISGRGLDDQLGRLATAFRAAFACSSLSDRSGPRGHAGPLRHLKSRDSLASFQFRAPAPPEAPGCPNRA